MRLAFGLAVALIATPLSAAAPVMSGMAAVAFRGGETVELRGVGWGGKGRFELPALGTRGTFSRSAERSGRGEVDYAGTVNFTVTRESEATVSGECRYF